MNQVRFVGIVTLCALVAVGLYLPARIGAASQMHKSSPFMGPKANTGYVTHMNQGGRQMLTLSDDFVVPDTPDPHWRVVDSNGNVYDLAKLKIKNDGYNKSVTLPPYIQDVVKVQIWCAWAETLLGEADFGKAVK